MGCQKKSVMFFATTYLLLFVVVVIGWIAQLVSSLSTSPAVQYNTFVILGGAGKIGTAVAAHLCRRSPGCTIVLTGRRPSQEGRKAIQEVEELLVKTEEDKRFLSKLHYEHVRDIWDPHDISILKDLFEQYETSCVIHTAGPYADRSPTVLDAAIAAGVPAYVDVSDPIPFLENSLKRHDKAVKSQTTALCAAGAFPGMSNVFAMEAASMASTKYGGELLDVRFNYFTKGLGGSGTINLYITNLGFGDPMTQHVEGRRRSIDYLSGKIMGTVDFFIVDQESVPTHKRKQNEEAKRRVGTQKVFAWPFPEAATVATELSLKGSSSAAMGTAPDIWNDMLGILVKVVPRSWWRSTQFSKFMADFSQPLVLFTDKFMGSIAQDGDSGETHAMRVDVVSKQQSSEIRSMVSVVQAHDSFRQCVGQSCAEFALDLLEHPNAGVFLPEQRYRANRDRQRIIDKLTATPGTFCHIGPMEVTKDDSQDELPVYPSNVLGQRHPAASQ
ncbi:KR domain containing protein [Nitzschia inconspicua]|uniref:KR domain containing protein n=1 Tax=Nitzschia inconspicua TaxID=303405 RepID=A0A9K3K5M1_9STRA|nr:KR domain containing protein [Nitzschia inconspicua]KAG7372418.1 KR domain containing protein [Nitzschia inconspicua]